MEAKSPVRNLRPGELSRSCEQDNPADKNKWTNIVGDGREKQSEMVKSAKKAELSFVFINEHNKFLSKLR